MSNCPTHIAGNGDAPTSLTDADRHRMLAAEHRRAALEALAERSTPVELESLAAAVGDALQDDASVDRIAIALHHGHLPKLADFGVLRYDAESKTVVSVDRRVETLTA